MILRTSEMTDVDRIRAIEWMDRRLAGKVNEDAEFPNDFLPHTGIAVYGDKGDWEKLLCVATLCLEKSSPVAVCGFLVTNPECRFRESYEAVKMAVKVLPVYASRLGAKYLMTTFGNRVINRFLAQNGFAQGDKNVQHFFKITGGR